MASGRSTGREERQRSLPGTGCGAGNRGDGIAASLGRERSSSREWTAGKEKAHRQGDQAGDQETCPGKQEVGPDGEDIKGAALRSLQDRRARTWPLNGARGVGKGEITDDRLPASEFR